MRSYSDGAAGVRARGDSLLRIIAVDFAADGDSRRRRREKDTSGKHALYHGYTLIESSCID